MSSELVPIRESSSHFTFTRDQLELLKRTIAKGTTDDELQLFVQTSQRLGLDPFARQIYAVKRSGVMAIQVAIDGFRLVAERTGCYAPGRPTEYETTDKGGIIAATAYVKKLVAGIWHEVAETAHWDEYVQKSPLWDRMPRVMLAKCAEARALRRAFPAQLAGVYAPEEMDPEDRHPVTSRPDLGNSTVAQLTESVDLASRIKAADMAELESLAKSTIHKGHPMRESLNVRYRELVAASKSPGSSPDEAA